MAESAPLRASCRSGSGKSTTARSQPRASGKSPRGSSRSRRAVSTPACSIETGRQNDMTKSGDHTYGTGTSPSTPKPTNVSGKQVLRAHRDPYAWISLECSSTKLPAARPNEIDAQNAHSSRGQIRPSSISVSFMAEYSLRPVPHTPMSRYIGISATSWEQEHREQVDRNKKAEYADRQQREPREILARHHGHLPRSQNPGKDDDRREQQHGHRYAVDADRIVYVQRSVPNRVGRIEHLGRIARRPLAQKQDSPAQRPKPAASRPPSSSPSARS